MRWYGTVQWTLIVVRDSSRVSWAGPGQFVEPSGRSRTGLGTLGEVQDGSGETLGEVRDGSGDPLGVPGRVGGPSRWYGTVQWTLIVVRDSSRVSWAGPGQFVEPSGRSRTGLGTLGEVQDGSGETLGEVRDGSGDPLGVPGRVGGPSRWYGTVQWTLIVVRDSSRVSWAGPGQFVEPSGRSRTGLGTLGEVRYGSLDPLGGSGRVEGPSGRYGSSGGTLAKVSTSWGTRGEVQDGSGDPREVRVGWEDPRRGPGRVRE